MTESICPASRSAPEPSEGEFIEFILPKVRQYANWRFCRLPPCEREEACSNADALGWQIYRGLVLRGKEPRKFAMRLARVVVCRVCAGRQVGSRVNCEDVLSRAGRIKHGISVQSIGDKTLDRRQGWRAIVVEDRRACPADVAAIRIDFEAWLTRPRDN